MGTTVVAASVLDHKLYVANVGDSRLYLVNREIRQITRDHSYVEEMVRRGELDKETAREHPDKNIITRDVYKRQGFVSCRSCGYVIKCPHCDVSLSLHKNRKMVRHYCGYEEDIVKACPQCKSKYLGSFKAGTQKVEQVIRKRCLLYTSRCV